MCLDIQLYKQIKYQFQKSTMHKVTLVAMLQRLLTTTTQKGATCQKWQKPQEDPSLLAPGSSSRKKNSPMRKALSTTISKND